MSELIYLDSINQVLDIKSLMMYPNEDNIFFTREKYDSYDGTHLSEISVEVIESCSDKDYDVLDKYFRDNEIIMGNYELTQDEDYGYGC